MDFLNLLIDTIRLSIGGACIITAIISGLFGLVIGISSNVEKRNCILALIICTVIEIVATVLAYVVTPELIGHIKELIRIENMIWITMTDFYSIA